MRLTKEIRAPWRKGSVLLCALCSKTLQCASLIVRPCSGKATAALCREREEQRAVMRAKEAEAEGRLRALHTHVLEFRSKARPVEEYTASDKAEQLQRAMQALEAARSRREQYEAQAQVL